MSLLGSILGGIGSSTLKYVAIGAAVLLAFLVARHTMDARDAAIREAGVASVQRDAAIVAANDTAAAWAQARADAALSERIAAETRGRIDASNKTVAELRRQLAAKAALPGGDAEMVPALKDAVDAWRRAVIGAAQPAPASPAAASPAAGRRMPGGPAVQPPAGWLDYCARNRVIDAGCPAGP